MNVRFVVVNAVRTFRAIRVRLMEKRKQQGKTRDQFCRSSGALEIQNRALPAKDVLEKRYLVIGRIGSDHWSAIITYRGAAIRIISVRKSTQAEIETYEKIAG